MHILIVDDDPLAAELSAAILQAAGYQTLVAEQALDALEQLEANPDLDVVVSDMHMPLMNGIEFFAEVRERGYPCRFILLTGDAPEELQTQQPGLDACLLKDFSLEHSLPRLVAELTASRHEA
ncbi:MULTISPECIES: response regulator [Thiorhodovibrio]|uniref:Response regulator with CheY-like receiver domain and winged-helix DNA-binding domain n=2 Tax=Thiorhodovibrio TaxID=61593 RepID=H8Z4R4_9GAMM|nr:MULTISPECIES: response regulator [Thiorhodovibrio]EIC20321.1 response regulator with CheY-like receiver domain and winged-helix DNA-binding domain [Thiorhodovibrio frisius]MBK5970715.1 response regulator [Thiorhodovibrio winogradskyi]WPL14260.1 Sensor kinase protein RcsC [Thiorhodovibrio litoralis]WPL21059.1 Sensor kinase protein RcsC [Thiorhodovibrio frisius]